MLPDRTSKRFRLRPLCAAVTAACLVSSVFAGATGVRAETPQETTAASPVNRLVEFQVDAAADTVARAKAEQYNNANNINKNINNVEQVVEALGPNGLKTKALRNFIMINWFYNAGVGSIDDPANANNAYLQAMRGADNDFYTRYSDSMYLVFKFNSADNSKLVLGTNGTNFGELEKGMKVILEGIKRRNTKVKYIECGNEFDLDTAFYGATKGNLADYMKMYKAFSNAVKYVNSLGLPGEPLQLGGPTLAQFSEMLLARFLDEAVANNDQVDFISWHHYRPDSLAFAQQTATVKKLLDDRHLTIPMVMSEYGYVGGGTDYNPSKELLAKNAAFMTDAAYQMSIGSNGHSIMPVSWVTSHDTAYFKNEFLTGYQLSRGSTDFEEYTIDQPAARRYLYIRGVGETAQGEATPANRGKPVIGIKELKLYDEAGTELIIPADAVSAINKDGVASAIHSVTDNNEATYWDGQDTTVAVESKVALRVDLGANAPTVQKISIKWHNVTGSPNMPVYRFRAYGSTDNIVIYDYLGHTSFTPFFHTLRMQSWMGDALLSTQGGSNEATGVRMMATRNSDSKVTMMVWNTQLDGLENFDVKVDVNKLPAGFTGKNVHIKRYLTDETHSNVQYNQDDTLDLVTDAVQEHNGKVSLDFPLTRNAVSFIELTAVTDPVRPLVLAHTFGNSQLPVNWVAGGNGSFDNLPGTDYLRANLADTQTIQPTFGYTSWTDYVVEVKVRSAENINLGESFNPGLLIRGHGATPRNNAYRFRLLGNGKARLQKVTNGTASQIKDVTLPASLTIRPQTWYTLKVEAAGNQFKFYIDGQLVLEHTDAAVGDFIAGNAGLMAGNVKTDFKDLKVYAAPAKLKKIQVNGTAITGFDSKQNVYTVKLPAGTASAVITAESTDDGKVILPDNGAVTLAANGGYVKYTLGAAAEAGQYTNTYTLYLHAQSADASLSAITFNAGADPVLVPGQTEYDVSLPSGTGNLLILKAVPAAALYGAKAEVIREPVLENGAATAVIRVTAENGNTQDYIFRMTIREAASRGDVIYSENFNDGMIKAGWSQPAINQFGVVEDVYGGSYAYRDVNANNILISNSSAVAGDADISVRVKATDPISYPGLTARVSDNEKNLYMLRIKPNESKVSLGKIINDTLKEPAAFTKSMPIDQNKWYQLRLVLKGDRIKAYLDDELLFDVTDAAGVFDTAFTPLRSGKTGIRVANARAAFDDLLVTAISNVNMAPVISLAGPSEVTVVQGNPYVDQGATALDPEDGNLTSSIIKTGEVDTSTPGDYILRYNVTDSGNTAAVEVIRTVHVVAASKDYTVVNQEPLKRTGGLEASVTVSLQAGAAGHAGKEYVYFQLLKGTAPVSYTVMEKDIGQPVELTAFFDAADPTDASYTVRVFVLGSFELDPGALPAALSDLLIME